MLRSRCACWLRRRNSSDLLRPEFYLLRYGYLLPRRHRLHARREVLPVKRCLQWLLLPDRSDLPHDREWGSSVLRPRAMRRSVLRLPRDLRQRPLWTWRTLRQHVLRVNTTLLRRDLLRYLHQWSLLSEAKCLWLDLLPVGANLQRWEVCVGLPKRHGFFKSTRWLCDLLPVVPM